MNAVEIRQITKEFGNVVAVKELSCDVPEGSIYGFIGPNGSGKTTTMRMIMGMIHPDRGTISVLGRPQEAALCQDVGYLPEERGLYRQMTVRDTLRFFARLHRLPHADERSIQWLRRFNLEGWLGKKVSTLSKGMAQKVQFIAAVIAEPRLLILDEPFSGLDPVNADALREAVLDLRRAGTTIIFSTHDMDMAEKLCDSIVMICEGRKVLDGSVQSIKESFGKNVVRVRWSKNPPGLGGIPGVAQISDFGNFQELRLEAETNHQSLIRELLQRGPLEHFECANPSLHDIFVRTVQAEVRRV